MKRTILLAVIVALVVLTTWSMLFSVHETQYAIVTRFGDIRKVIQEPGLNWKWPAPIEAVVFFDNRLLVLDKPGPNEPPKEFLTEDKKNIEVASYTCWKIQDPRRFLETMMTREQAEAALGDVVAAELGTALGNHELSSLLFVKTDETESAEPQAPQSQPEELELDKIMRQVRDACRNKAAQAGYGIEIVDFRIKRINFPDQNRQSVFQRMRAERKRIATRHRSEGNEEAAKIEAQANKTKTEILARADREEQRTLGRAEAEATRIYADAFGQDTEFYEFLRTIESYQKSLTRQTTIILPADSPYLRLLSSIEAVLGSPAPAGPDASDVATPTTHDEALEGVDDAGPR